MLGALSAQPDSLAFIVVVGGALCVCTIGRVCVHVHARVCVCLWEHLGVYMGNRWLCSFVLCDLAEFLLELQYFRRYFANNPLVYYLLSGHKKKKWS